MMVNVIINNVSTDQYSIQYIFASKSQPIELKKFSCMKILLYCIQFKWNWISNVKYLFVIFLLKNIANSNYL